MPSPSIYILLLLLSNLSSACPVEAPAQKAFDSIQKAMEKAREQKRLEELKSITLSISRASR